MFALLIPTGSDHDRSRVPVATLSLIAVNVVIYFVSNLLNYEQIARQFGFVAAHPSPYQFVTHMFLHAGWPTAADADWMAYVRSVLHIGGNMAYLWFAGSDLEDVFGPWKFLALYFLAGIASAALFWLTATIGANEFSNLNEPAVGASGAISGLLGLYLVRFLRFKIRMWFAAMIPIPFIMRQGITRISSIVFIGFWIGLQTVFGVMALHAGGAEVAYWGHIGGFILGCAVGLLTRQWRYGQQEYLLKEADYQFYKQKWYPSMELYQRVAGRYPRCVEAFTKWALCWECVGMPKRAEKVLSDALYIYEEHGWADEAAAIHQELQSMLGKASVDTAARAKEKLAADPSAPKYPNLMFRRDLKGKGAKGHDHH